MTLSGPRDVGAKIASDLPVGWPRKQAVQSPDKKYFALRIPIIGSMVRSSRLDAEGRIAIVTTCEAGMRWTRGRCETSIVGADAKSCGPGLPTLRSSSRDDDLAGDGSKQARFPGSNCAEVDRRSAGLKAGAKTRHRLRRLKALTPSARRSVGLACARPRTERSKALDQLTAPRSGSDPISRRGRSSY